ncbi:MAG: thiol-disulfide oxidoreductase DCC family protein [Ignavibacteria bacterium]
MLFRNLQESKLIPLPNCTVVFDSNCLLCNALVQFLAKHDRKKLLWFVSNTSERIKAVCDTSLTSHSLLFYKSGVFYRESTAILKILSLIEFPYPVLYALIIIPPLLRDGIYKIVSRVRHKIKWQSSPVCEFSTQLKSRILD